MQEMQVPPLGGEDPLEKEMATHSSILAWEVPWVGYSPWGHKELDTTEQLSTLFSSLLLKIHFQGKNYNTVL